MKKLLITILIIFSGLSVYSQTYETQGLGVGDPDVPGSNVAVFDSITEVGSVLHYYVDGVEVASIDTTKLDARITANTDALADAVQASEITVGLDALYVQDSMKLKDGKIGHFVGSTQYYPAIQEERHIIRALQSMGSTIKAIPIFGDAIPFGTGALLHQRVQLTSLYLDKPDTITGAWIAPSVTGAYVTNANINKIGLYNVSGDTLRLIASTASDSTLWAQTDSTFYQKAFSAKVYAQRGYYAIAFFYSRASSTTSPQIAATAGVTGRNARILTGTNYFSSGSIDGQADLPLKIALSAVTIQPGIYWGAIY